MRPGEKLFEELETDSEAIAKTKHPKIYIGQLAPCPTETLSRAMADFGRITNAGDESALRNRLAELLPESNLCRVAVAPAAPEPMPTSSPSIPVIAAATQ